MSRFATLLRREWMQHHRGYLALAVTPPVLLLLLISFAPHVQVQPSVPTGVMAIATFAFTAIVTGLTWLAMAFQLPGLARRDQQDRSIEFWVSLPVAHSASVGSTLLFHAILMPLMALLIGFAFSQVLGLVLVAMVAGASAWMELPWGVLMLDSAVFVLRLALGVTLATLWLSPLLMVLMLASATLKRWGVPAVVGGTLTAGLVLHHGFGIQVIGNLLAALFQAAAFSVSPVGAGDHKLKVGDGGEGLTEALQMFPGIAWDSAVAALGHLASPLFVGAALVSAACFFGLVVQRRRNG